MPKVIPYNVVLDRMNADGFRCLYPNGGAFGYPPGADAAVRALGWVGTPDSTIRPAARPLVRQVAPPFESTLARLAARVWQEHLSVPAWVMPKSHWSFELDFGSSGWMPGTLRRAGIDPTVLAPLTTGAAIEFAMGESETFVPFIESLLTHLLGSDFLIAWPGRSVLCTVHHHKQLWWMTTEPAIHAYLETLVPSGV